MTSNITFTLDQIAASGESRYLKSTICHRGDTEYKIIRYDKSILSHGLMGVYGIYRSVVLNADDHVICFSPPKAVAADMFLQCYPVSDDIIAEEFVEGTMINVFFDASIQQWEIATKSTVGAETTFYKTAFAKTFREMFFEAVTACELNLDQDLNKKYCYSFVLQHPENRIVVPFASPQLYLVNVFEIVNENNTVIQRPREEFFYTHTGSVKAPQSYSFQSYNELIDRYASMNTLYTVVGVMLHNMKTGDRAKIRNPVYEQVRALRGNQPKLQYQYLCLRKEGKVREFLTYYPEKKDEFSRFRDQLHMFTHTLHANYVACYILKTQELREFPEQYRTHMYHLHQLYRNELKDKKQYVNGHVVQSYVNELHPSLLMHCLNLPLRQNAVDVLVASEQ